MTVFRFDCLGPETFLRGRWVGIHLYDGRKVSVPVEIPRASQIENLADAEVIALFVLVSIATAGRGHSVDGWPRWAQGVAAGDGRWPAREGLGKLLHFIAHDRCIAIGANAHVPMPQVTNDGALEFEDGSTLQIGDLVDEDGNLKKDQWLRRSPSPRS